MVLAGYDTSNLVALYNDGVQCETCCSPDICAEFGTDVDVTIAGLTLCGSTSYNGNCGVADPLDVAALLGDPNGKVRLSFGIHANPAFFSPAYHLSSGDWWYFAFCAGEPARWTIFVAPDAYGALNAFLSTNVRANVEFPNTYATSGSCGGGNCQDAFGQCGYDGTALLEFVA